MDQDGAVGLAYPRKMVEHIILGLSNPVNRHLIKLIAFDFPPEMRQHFRRELRTWLRDIRTLKFKSNKRPGPSKFYFELLFEYPFGGVEVENVTILMDAISEDYEGILPIKRPEEMAAWLRDFHTRLAERLHRGEDVLDMIPE
ncbi:MAG: hypothetical protein AB7H90_01770 [Alphaproteobacteria bacterium]